MAEQADAPDSKPGVHGREGSTPSGGTLTDRPRTPEEVARFIERYRADIERFRGGFEKRSLMYGGSLNGVEAAWNVLHVMEAFLEGEDIFDASDDSDFTAYARIASKYKCGNWVISAKVAHEMGETVEAAAELIRRLKEVDALRAELRAKRKAGK